MASQQLIGSGVWMLADSLGRIDPGSAAGLDLAAPQADVDQPGSLGLSRPGRADRRSAGLGALEALEDLKDLEDLEDFSGHLDLLQCIRIHFELPWRRASASTSTGARVGGWRSTLAHLYAAFIRWRRVTSPVL